MKFPLLVTALLAAMPALAASAPAQMVITVQSGPRGGAPARLEASDVTVVQDKTSLPVTGLERLTGDLADMELFVLLDDSTRSSSLSVHLPELKSFLESLPATTQVAVGYMRNGTFLLAQAFTADHHKAADSLRLPEGTPGENGSPYFAISDLAKHWPSKQATGRRAALVLTDGVDRYYDTSTEDDPYVDAAIQDSLKNKVAVYSIYLRGAGLYGRAGMVQNFSQSRLMAVGEQTGGFAYFEGFTDPVDIAPFLTDFHKRLDNQYKVTFQALNQRGVQPVKLRTEAPGVKIEGPSRIYVP